jgi:amidase
MEDPAARARETASPPMVVEDRPLYELSASEIADGIARRRFTPVEIVRACLERIAAREPVVGAWVHLDPDHALAQARALEAGPVRGPLHGIPVGIKDVLDTHDMPTGMGSPIYGGYRPPADASCVAMLRGAGAVILGKTVSAEFAGMTPGKTANPHDPSRTPGGSSSGSAAAVADFMVPLALGTQTGGSVLRPSSYCGIVGFKPSFGAINRAGLKMAAESLDTIGLHARTVEDVALLYGAFTGARKSPGRFTDSPPRVGLCRTFMWDEAAPETKDAVEGAAAAVATAGAEVTEVELPRAFEELMAARIVINNVERARALAFEWHHHRALISETLAEVLEQGLKTPPDDYVDALRLAERLRARIDDAFGACDVLLAPCVNGEAPTGLSWTGDPRLQGIWTALHLPAMSLPTHAGPNGLPVGIQLVGRLHDDHRLLAAGRWVLSLYR